MNFSNFVAALLLASSAALTAHAATAPVERATTHTNVRPLAADQAVTPAAAHAVRRASTAPRRDALSVAGSTGELEREPLPSGWLMALVTIGLIGYQLRRKHRLLRPQRFT